MRTEERRKKKEERRKEKQSRKIDGRKKEEESEYQKADPGEPMAENVTQKVFYLREIVTEREKRDRIIRAFAWYVRKVRLVRVFQRTTTVRIVSADRVDAR